MSGGGALTCSCCCSQRVAFVLSSAYAARLNHKTRFRHPRRSPPGLTGDASESCVDFIEEDDVIAVYNPSRWVTHWGDTGVTHW